jgi:ribosomal protein S14
MKFKRFTKDKNNRLMFKRCEVKNLFLYFLIKSCYSYIFIFLKFSAFFLSKNYYKNKIKNYCIESGRANSVYKSFKLSRIYLRDFGSQGLILGLKKSMW